MGISLDTYLITFYVDPLGDLVILQTELLEGLYNV